MSLQRIWLLTAACLCLTVLAFELSSWDMTVQQLFFNSSTGEWLWPKHEPVLKAFLYDGIKAVVILCAISLAIVLLVARKSTLVGKYRRGLQIVLLSMILVPSTVATLKQITDMACPCKLKAFGGSYVYVKLFQQQAIENKHQQQQECYPAAHASIGFSLVSLFFLFKTRKSRRIALASAITLGWIMGLYKMAIGDHFLSHTLVSMQLGWLISSGIALALQFKDKRIQHRATDFSMELKERV